MGKAFTFALLLSVFTAQVLPALAEVADNPYLPCIAAGDNLRAPFGISCLSSNEKGYFEVAAPLVSGCRLKKSSGIDRWRSGYSRLGLKLPLSQFSAGAPAGSDVFVEILPRVGEGKETPACGTAHATALVAEIKMAASTLSTPVQAGVGQWKLPDLPRHLYFYSLGNNAAGKPEVFRPNRTKGAEGDYDLYYKATNGKEVDYFVRCSSWNNECHGAAANGADGRYRYDVSFSRAHEARVFELMEELVPYLDSLYVQKD